jgi:hypothetical protein
MTSLKEGSGTAQYASVLSREVDSFEKVNPSLPCMPHCLFPSMVISHLRGPNISNWDIVDLVPGSKPPDTKFS